MRIWVSLAAAACVVVLAAPVSAEDKPFSDNEFIMKAASSGMAEVALGKIAQVKATNAEVKKFAERMVTDHGKVNEELARIVRDMKGTLPEKPAEEHEKHLKHFSGGEVKNFDQEYMKHMVESHTKGVELFTKASKECKNAQLKAFAEKTLPTVKEHLELAKNLNEQLNK
jgi:putative membrane protein